jgi:ubiquinone/menaquinone biosynthesis C-methylase UbiE
MTMAYFNRMASKWDENIAEKDQARLERLAQSLDIKPGSNLLDVGTGTGVFIPFLLRRIGSRGRLVCLDFAAEMLQRARDKKFADNINFVCQDITRTSLESRSFESVVCYSSFPHFADKPGALKEINRLLKPGGKLFICHSSSRESINRIHKHIHILSHDLIPENEKMRELLLAAQFKDIAIQEDPESYLAIAVK